MVDLLPPELQELFDTQTLLMALRTLVALVLSLLAVRLVGFIVGKVVRRRISDQSAMLLRKTINYSGFILVLMVVLSRFTVTAFPLAPVKWDTANVTWLTPPRRSATATAFPR